MFRSLAPLAGLALCLACFVLVANGRPRTPTRTAPPRVAAPPHVLMIGDSLSVAAFGETLQEHLAHKLGRPNVAAYASCGSSPEHWLADEPFFFTKCGYREAVPGRPPLKLDFANGRPPPPTRTPKLPDLVRRHQPDIVVVQLGTNWMDRPLTDEKINAILARFVGAVRAGRPNRRIIWVAPPDSSALKKRQGRIHHLIQQAAQRHRFEVIDSRRLTRYIPGKTGGDGIHYNKEASQAWAHRVAQSLDGRLRKL